MPAAKTRGSATLADLEQVDTKAELVDGRIVFIMPTGQWPGRVGVRIFVSLDAHTSRTKVGLATPDGVGCNVPELPSGRESFCPDAAYFANQIPSKQMRFVVGPPSFAVEVRSENDYGPTAERALAAKRADDFEAGTLIVWDVDPQEECIHAYQTEAPGERLTYQKGQVADAEPAVPGWRLVVDEIFA